MGEMPRVPTSHPSPLPPPRYLAIAAGTRQRGWPWGPGCGQRPPWALLCSVALEARPLPAQGSVARRDHSAWSCILGPGLPRGQPRTPCAPRRAGRSLGLLPTWGFSSPDAPWTLGPAHDMLGDLGRVPFTHRASVSLRHGNVPREDAARVRCLDSLPAPPWVPLSLIHTRTPTPALLPTGF